MTLKKESKGHGMPWEDSYGYAQAVRSGKTIYVSGQLSHDDDGNIVGALTQLIEIKFIAEL